MACRFVCTTLNSAPPCLDNRNPDMSVVVVVVVVVAAERVCVVLEKLAGVAVAYTTLVDSQQAASAESIEVYGVVAECWGCTSAGWGRKAAV